MSAVYAMVNASSTNNVSNSSLFEKCISNKLTLLYVTYLLQRMKQQYK